MFKKFSVKEDVSSTNSLKSSLQRNIRSKVLEQYPYLAELSGSTEEGKEGEVILDLVWNKKESLTLAKCREHISIYTINSIPLFFQHFDGPFWPTLKLMHQFPDMMPHVSVDRGAIRFLLAGANMMAPGLTSPGGSLPPKELALEKDTPVAIFAEGKEHCVGVGLLKMGTEEIKSVNKGIAIETVHYLGDDLWAIKDI